MRYKTGTLWREIIRKTEYALRVGSLKPIATESDFIEDGGVRFLVRLLSGHERKRMAQWERERESKKSKERVNPFLPYEKDMFIAEISQTHLALLNKFNVMDHHLLIVTRTYEDQDMLLTREDFVALWSCLAEYNGLGFYNAGPTAGASQPHKHLQVVPLPLVRQGPQVPIDPLLEKGGFIEEIGAVPEFLYRHAWVRFKTGMAESPQSAAEESFKWYGKMLRSMELASPAPGRPKRQSGPYCLLITREWMLLVPRSVECFGSISINSLGFAGIFLVRNKDEFVQLRKVRPLTALGTVAFPLNDSFESKGRRQPEGYH